jgi:serine/threonine-protein kinase RsbW
VTARGFRRRIEPPTVEGVAEAAVELDAWCRRGGIDERYRRDLLLIHDELASNVARHAGGASFVAVRARIEPEPDRIVYVIEDDGARFDPLSRARPATDAPLEERVPGGLGVHLVRTLAARVAWRRNRGRNRLEVEVSL